MSSCDSDSISGFINNHVAMADLNPSGRLIAPDFQSNGGDYLDIVVPATGGFDQLYLTVPQSDPSGLSTTSMAQKVPILTY